MTAYIFETITAAQALAIQPTDTVVSQQSFSDLNYAPRVEYQDATATVPERYAVTLGSQTVVFGANLAPLSWSGGFVSADQLLLTIGGQYGDPITGDSNRRLIYGLGGDDQLTAGGNNDILYGGEGADALRSGASNDTLVGNAGDDSIFVGSGFDTVDGGVGFDTLVMNGARSDFSVYVGLSGMMDVEDLRANIGHTLISGIERLHFDDGDFTTSSLIKINRIEQDDAEGDVGLKAHHFQAVRTSDITVSLTVTWVAKSDSGADLEHTTGQVTFAPYVDTVDFVVNTINDDMPEPKETFEVSFQDTPSLTFVNGPASASDLNDDGDGNFFAAALANSAHAEGNSGGSDISFTITRTGATDLARSVSYDVAGSGSHPADAADFVGGALPSGTLQFAANETSKTLTLHVQGDAAIESDEQFTLALHSDRTGDVVSGVGVNAIIYDDDQPPASGGGSGSQNGGGMVGDAGPDTIQGTAGADTINGGDGTSYLRGGEGNDVVTGGKDFDDINGNQGDDTASGGLGDDWVVGGKDNDSLTGDGGDDIVYGNMGDDYCDGGDGADIVRGGQQNDVIFGRAGNDWLSGDRGDDTLAGGAGADVFHTFGDAGIDRVLDFSLAEGDRVMLDPGTTYSLSQVGADTVIAMGGGSQMVLVGVSMSSLSGDWIFGA